MIRSTELKDKLVADLHFHHYLTAHGGDFFGNGAGISDRQINSFLTSLGIDPSTSLYHSGVVVEKSDYIYQIIDDIFIDYFFRKYDFKEIVFPKGYCYEQITPNGVVHPTEDLTLNLKNIYDRCTFVNNMLRIFFDDAKCTIGRISECDGFLCGLSCDEKKFSPAEDFKNILTHDRFYPFEMDLEQYIRECHSGKALCKSDRRTAEIISYYEYIHKDLFHSDLSYGKSMYSIYALTDFSRDYQNIKDNHIFGDYSIEDLLIIYCILVDKLVLCEDYLLVALLYCIDDIEKTFLMEFDTFERDNTDYHILDTSINSKDLYLRFTSRAKSKAFRFSVINNAVETIEFFNQGPIRSVYRGNTLPLPYLYSQLNLV